MLQQIRFQNLGLFDDKTCYSIKLDTNDDKEGGIAILVGENGSGKSSVFEFVRRCMSTEITKSETNKYKHDKVAFVKCHLKVENKPLEELKDLNEIASVIPARTAAGERQGETKLLEILEKYTDKAKEQQKDVMVGVFYNKNENPTKYRFMHVCIDGDTKSDIFLLERCFPSVDATEYIVAVETSEIKEKLNKLDTLDWEESSQAVTVLIQNFYDILGTYQEKVNYTESKQVDGLVNAFYSKLFGNGGRTSFLFAHRGISPLDSSLSDKMARGQLNYEDTVSKAELMAVKLGKFNENQRKKYIDVANNILGYEKTVYEFHPSGKNNIVMIDNEN